MVSREQELIILKNHEWINKKTGIRWYVRAVSFANGSKTLIEVSLQTWERSYDYAHQNVKPEELLEEFEPLIGAAKVLYGK